MFKNGVDVNNQMGLVNNAKDVAAASGVLGKFEGSVKSDALKDGWTKAKGKGAWGKAGDALKASVI